MAGFTLGPIASGLPKDIVDRLMEAERRPLEMLQLRKKNEEDRLKLVGDLSSRLSNANAEFSKLGRFKDFRELGNTVGRPDLMDITVNKDLAEPGEYQIQVMQLAGRSSMMSNGFEDPNNTQIGVGYFSYDLPSGETKEIYIDDTDNTLYGIAKKINSERSLSLQAIVVNDGTGSDEPWRIIVSTQKSGEANDAEFPEFYFVDGDQDFYMDQEKPAQNSVLKVNGFEVEFEGTRIDTLFPGVIMDLKDADPGKEFQLRVFEDRAKVEDKITGVVNKINEVLVFIQQQNKLDESSNTSNTLGGDVTIQNIESLIRRAVTTPIETDFGPIRFSDMGVTFQRTGLLEENKGKLEKALEDNFEAVAQFFTGRPEEPGSGFTTKLVNKIKSFIQPGGVVASRNEGLKQRIQDVDRQIERTEKNLESTRAMLTQKFANLDAAMARMKGQQQYVGAMAGGGGGGGISLGG